MERASRRHGNTSLFDFTARGSGQSRPVLSKHPKAISETDKASTRTLESIVSLRIPVTDAELLQAVQSRGGYWDARRRVWRLSKRAASEMDLAAYLVD